MTFPAQGPLRRPGRPGLAFSHGVADQFLHDPAIGSGRSTLSAIGRRLQPVLLAALAVLGVGETGARAGTPEVRYEPPPAWVEMRPLPAEHETPSDQLRDGVHILLFERQTRVGRQRIERFDRFVRRVVSRPGLDTVSHITIDFDPSYQQLAIHSLRILRDGREIDALDPPAVRLLQRETDLEYGIFDGRFTATLVPEDVRIGDVVEYAYTVRGSNPVFGGHYMGEVWGQSTHPYRELRFRLLWPANRALYLRDRGGMVAPATRSLGEYTEYVWDLQDTQPILPDSQLPDWYYWYDWTQLSDFADWSEVASWGADVFGRQAHSSPSVRETAQRIATLHADPSNRLLAALRFVQDEVRYVGIEIGPSSHQPHSPASVLARRFGDCKDKSLLLIALLRELGIEADPALVSTDLRTHVEEWHPSPFAFDHAIVRATVEGRVVWVDPTRSYQGGGLPGWSYDTSALALRSDTKDLERIPARAEDAPSQQVEYRFESPDLEAPTDLVITTVARVEAANHLRSYFQGNSRDGIATRYLEYYAPRFPGIESAGKLEFEDDRVANVVRVKERYRIPGFWESNDDGERGAHYYPLEIRSRIFRPDTVDRKMPIGREHPDHIALKIRATLPMEFQPAKSTRVVADPAFRLRYDEKVGPRALELSYDYVSLSDSVSPEQSAAYLEHVDQAQNLLAFSLWSTPGDSPSRAPAVAFAASLGLLLLLASPGFRWLAFRARRKGHLQAGIRHATWYHRFAVASPRPLLNRAAAAIHLAELEAVAGRDARAEALLKAALRRTTGESRAATAVHASVLLALAELRDSQKRFEEADGYLHRAEQATRRLPYPQPTQRAAQILLRVRVNARLGIVEGAAAAISEAEFLGRGDAGVGFAAASTRARVAQAEGDDPRAGRILAGNVRAAEETFGAHHPLTAAARDELTEFQRARAAPASPTRDAS